MNKIAKQQSLLHDLARKRRISLEAERVSLRKSLSDLVDALNSDNPCHGLFVGAAGNRMRQLSQLTSWNAEQLISAKRNVLGSGRKLKSAEERAAQNAQDEARLAERRALEELCARLSSDPEISSR